MKVLKINEMSWSVDSYLVNNDVKNLNTVKDFVNYFKLSNIIIDIWNYGKILNIYPDKLTIEEILYITEDGSKILIKIENGNITTISKIKIEYIDHNFVPKVIDKSNFSFEKFKYYLNK